MSEWQPRGTTRRIGHADSQKLLSRLMSLTTAAPRLIGDGPVEFSTSHAIDLIPRIIWDTNGFYRELGVPVDASRGDIKRAYIAKRGHESSRLTKIVKTLIDPYLRSRYDCAQIGTFFADDDNLYVSAWDIAHSNFKPVKMDNEWSVYAWGIGDNEVNYAMLAELRVMVAKMWWDAGRVERMAVGMCSPDRRMCFALVGQRSVAFVPTTGIAKDS